MSCNASSCVSIQLPSPLPPFLRGKAIKVGNQLSEAVFYTKFLSALPFPAKASGGNRTGKKGDELYLIHYCSSKGGESGLPQTEGMARPSPLAGAETLPDPGTGGLSRNIITPRAGFLTRRFDNRSVCKYR